MKLPDEQKRRGTGCGMGEAGSKSGFGESSWQKPQEQGGAGRWCTRSLCGEGIPGVGSQLGLQQSRIHTDTHRQILAAREEPRCRELP